MPHPDGSGDLYDHTHGARVLSMVSISSNARNLTTRRRQSDLSEFPSHVQPDDLAEFLNSLTSGTGTTSAGSDSFQSRGLQQDQESDGLLRSREEGRLRIHFRDKNAGIREKRRFSSGRLHGSDGLEDPVRSLPSQI